jgi:hypothetical protein
MYRRPMPEYIVTVPRSVRPEESDALLKRGAVVPVHGPGDLLPNAPADRIGVPNVADEEAALAFVLVDVKLTEDELKYVKVERYRGGMI